MGNMTITIRDDGTGQGTPPWADSVPYESRICDMIRERRKAIGLTQSQLADALGVSQQSVSKWEGRRAVPDVSMFPLIAEVLELPDFGSVGLAGTPRWEQIPIRGLREELERFHRIVSLRETPWLMPGDLHANPLDIERRGWQACREQVAYEVARILEVALGMRTDQVRDLQQILWILTCVPGGSVEDVSLFLWSEQARRHMHSFAIGRAGYDSRAGIIDRICDGRSSLRSDIMHTALSPVIDNPYVMRRVSSIWHPEASHEAMIRERDARNECLASKDYEYVEIAIHADRIAKWDGRHDCTKPTFDEMVPSAVAKLAFERMQGGESEEDVAREFTESPGAMVAMLLDIPAGRELMGAAGHADGSGLTEDEMRTVREQVEKYGTALARMASDEEGASDGPFDGTERIYSLDEIFADDGPEDPDQWNGIGDLERYPF